MYGKVDASTQKRYDKIRKYIYKNVHYSAI